MGETRTCRLAAEKDASERDSREKETKLLNLTRQLEEFRDRLAESERLRAQQQRELDDLTSSQDDAGKNVRFGAVKTRCRFRQKCPHN